MSVRRAIVWALIAGLLGLAVLAYFGSALLFAFYLAALGNAVSFHWWYACSRCSNMCCALNVRGPEFFMRVKPVRMVGEPEREFSDIRSIVGAVPVVLSVLIGLWAAWLWSPVAALLWTAYAAVVAYAYWKTSCPGCGNDCPVNRNPAYRRWKQGPG